MAIIEIPPIVIKTMIITLVGDSSLIVHKWSEKAKKQMLDKQMGAAVQKKAPKDPEQDFRDSLYPAYPVACQFGELVVTCHHGSTRISDNAS